MSTPNHHPDEALIYQFAKGSLEESFNLIISTHIHSCPKCQSKIAEAEDICGYFFSQLPKEAVDNTLSDEDTFDKLWKNISESENTVLHSSPVSKPSIKRSPLENYLERNQSRLEKKSSFSNITETILPLSGNDIRVSIMEIGAAVEIPQHTHTGYEMTQIISGGFYDQKGSYHAGDMTIKDSNDFHAPKIFDDEPCKCLVVRCGSLKFTGSMGLIYNSLFKFFG